MKNITLQTAYIVILISQVDPQFHKVLDTWTSVKLANKSIKNHKNNSVIVGQEFCFLREPINNPTIL